MLIDISKIPIFWTTCDKSIGERQDRFIEMLKQNNLQAQKINGPITNPYTIGVAHGYLEALSKCKPPFLILEDDATVNPNFEIKYKFDLPDDCDALYLGTSLFARIKGKSIIGGLIVGNYSENYFKIFNMLGFHAVLYISKRYIDHCKNILNEFIKNPIGGTDDPIAESMFKFNIYSLKIPMFYQHDGRSEQATLGKIEPVL